MHTFNTCLCLYTPYKYLYELYVLCTSNNFPFQFPVKIVIKLNTEMQLSISKGKRNANHVNVMLKKQIRTIN